MERIPFTREGLERLKSELEHLQKVERPQNIRAIEEARSHGDLRENAEYKAALERRDRLQSEIKTLSEQLNKIKLLTKQEIITDKASVGTIIDCKNEKGVQNTFTILGPFEADAEKNILSFQSKLAKEILGKTIGEKFSLKENEYTIIDIRNYFE